MTLALMFVATSVADGRSSKSNACGAAAYSYAGVQSTTRTHGIGAVVDPLQTPSVSAGHVGAWLGLGGTEQGPGGTAEWIQVGFSAFPNDKLSRIYYEVTVAGSEPKYVELGCVHGRAVRRHDRRRERLVAGLARRQGRQPSHPPAGQSRQLVRAGGGRELERRRSRLQHVPLPILERSAGARRRR